MDRQRLVLAQLWTANLDYLLNLLCLCGHSRSFKTMLEVDTWGLNSALPCVQAWPIELRQLFISLYQNHSTEDGVRQDQNSNCRSHGFRPSDAVTPMQTNMQTYLIWGSSVLLALDIFTSFFLHSWIAKTYHNWLLWFSLWEKRSHVTFPLVNTANWACTLH